MEQFILPKFPNRIEIRLYKDFIYRQLFWKIARKGTLNRKILTSLTEVSLYDIQ